MVVVAALQMGSSPEGTAVTLERVLGFEEEIRAANAAVVVMPEAILGGYPESRMSDEQYARYFSQAVEIPGPEIEALAGLAATTGASLVVGVIERRGSTLYCTAVFLDPVRGLTASHRKLVPTGRERVVWGRGDGSTLPVVPTAAGLAGAAICWENLMPLLRAAMYAKGVELWCAPTVDDGDAWLATARHIACEGRCFVVSACQQGTSEAFTGGSVIVGPRGDVLAGPLREGEGLLTAEIDPAEVVTARRDLDVSGHYARPDVFALTVDETARPGVTYRADA
jgi:nitrilase